MHLAVLACDLDGTLAQDGRVSPETWQALRQAKLAGLTMILVTGRVLDSFLTSGPYDELFAAIVAEDGAVVRFPNRDETAMPFGALSPEVKVRIMALDLPLEQGQAILATRVPHDQAILEELRKTGGGATVEYNRGAVMILPSGATKATGLHYALDEIQSLCPRGDDGLTDLVLQGMERGGVTVVSYRPSLVSREVLEAFDYYVLNSLYLPEEIEEVTALIAEFGGDTSVLSDLTTLSQDQAYVYLRQRKEPFHVQMRSAARQVPHVRHFHKYLRGSLAPAKRFYFHSPSGRDHFPAAGNLWELRQALADLPLDTLKYHLNRHDFEHWLKQVLHDETLARRLRKIRHRRPSGEELRRALLETVINRYGELNRLT